MTKIFIGSDHGGYNLKEKIKEVFSKLGYEFEDVGTNSTDSCDYPVYAQKVAQKVIDTEGKGILVCGTGIGMSIAANKFKGIRASHCTDTFSARMTREHNDSNILCLGERITGQDLALDIVKVWLETPFSNGERHIQRLNLIRETEGK
ncbi:MAG: ribose 5-phosphate isomerase B [Cyanobacteria bacterium RUI128]|nr:ribose 5-phosphate isomerase B [Cyanobacteria bacterium RUI128]